MTGIYALIRPDGGLEFRDGVPEQMCKDADPHHGALAAFIIQHAAWGGSGLHGHVADTSTLDGAAYPPNRVARPLVAALGGPDQYVFGNLTICGSHTTPDTGAKHSSDSSMTSTPSSPRKLKAPDRFG